MSMKNKFFKWRIICPENRKGNYTIEKWMNVCDDVYVRV